MSNNELVAEQEEQGDSLDQARLEAMLTDRTATAQAALMREVARLQLDNMHLKKQNLRSWSTAGVLATTLLMGTGAIFWWFPKYRYIATTDNKAVCEVGTQGSNIVTPATLAEFAKDAMINSYSYDYVNYRSTLDAVTSKWYTERGRKAYLKSLDDSGNLERVVKGRLIMKAFGTNAPQLESEGKEGTKRFWIVHVPIAIEFYVGGNQTPNSVQDFLAEVKIMEMQASALNTKGTGVDSVVLRPSSRGK